MSLSFRLRSHRLQIVCGPGLHAIPRPVATTCLTLMVLSASLLGPALAVRLQEEGAVAFGKSWSELMDCVASKSEALKNTG